MIAAALWFGAAYLLWLAFLVVMALKARWSTLPIVTRVLASPAVLFVVAFDIGFNLAATVLFIDLPREATFSQRMSRYKRGDGLRSTVARWVCANLLDPFEVGGHCRD